ncbi:transporter substrate-binding domain-containing protein [Petroclostridium sp. X23]|uniref:transporter substrate-binding domain-containing protein n=1 Tax=Petroclostridium sp. X23 TaxID=3045146 RepID=UPI0024ACE220|nr:transporter substrate-binding domain-containing protein [Petroclostridium sp. X23]WHH59974.1 transporter substrate-binding domain-containing protein [Petroclostridium sp. X23]
MKLSKNIILTAAAVSILGALVTGCGAQKSVSEQPSTSTDSKAKKILVGTMGTYSPFTYQDDKGQLTGYDIEVLREVDKRLDDIELEFVPTPWDSMFLGLESDKYQIVANQISKNPDREKKYLFTDNSYFASTSSIIVKKGRQGISSLDDLKGLKVGTAVGDSFTKILEDYNAKNNNALELKYYDGNVTTVLQDLEAGRIDAYLNDPIMVNENVKKLGLNVEPTGEPVEVSPAYFVFRKDAQGEELRDKIDKTLSEMKEDGTLSNISIQWFEEDYTNIESKK